MSDLGLTDKEINKKTTSGIISLSLRYIVTYGFQAISTTTLARFLTATDYGVFGILQNWIGSLGYTTDIGLKESIIQQQTPATREQLKAYLAVRSSLALITSIMFALGFYFFDKKLNITDDSNILFYFLGLINLLEVLISLPILQIQKSLNFKKQARIEIVSSIFLYTAQITLAIAGFGFWSLFAGNIVKHLVVIFYGIATRLFVLPSFSHFSSIKHLFKFGLFFQLASLIFALKGILEPILLKSFINMEDLGLFYWSFGLISAPLGIIFTSIQVLFPTISKIQNNEEQLIRLVSRGFELISLAIVIIYGLGAVCSPFLIEILFPQRWYEAKPLMAPICLIVSLFALRQIPIVILTGLGLSKEKFNNEVIFFFIFFGSSLVLIQKYSLNGHIIATIIGHLVSMIYLIVKTKRFLYRKSLYKSLILFSGAIGAVLATYRIGDVESIWLSLPIFLTISGTFYYLFDKTIFNDFGFLLGLFKRKS